MMAGKILILPRSDELLIINRRNLRAVMVPLELSSLIQGALQDNTKELPEWLCDILAAVGFVPEAAPGAWKSDILVRNRAELDIRRIVWELTERCNFRCAHCYLGKRKRSGGLPFGDRLRLLDKFALMGCLWLQLTGGEALADPLFEQTYRAAWDRGIIISLSTNGLLLSRWIDLFRNMPPRRVTVSLYGASESSYTAMTGTTRNTLGNVIHGLEEAQASGIRLRVSVIVAKPNVQDVSVMEKMLIRMGIEHHVYSRMIPTVDGKPTPLELMADLGRPTVFFHPKNGCSGGTLALHVRSSGRASPCRLLPNISVDLLSEDLTRVKRLAIHPGIQPTTSNCTMCAMSNYCSTCGPILALHKKAGNIPFRICPSYAV